MIRQLERLMMYSEETKERLNYLEYRFRDHEHKCELMFDFVMLQYEATEADYQDRLELIAKDIKKYTLSEVECMRFMSDRQFNNLRASKA